MRFNSDAIVWTDFGGVLTPSVSESFSAFARYVQIEPGELMRGMRAVSTRYGAEDVLAPLEAGHLEEREWAEGLSAILDLPIAADALSGSWFTARPVNQIWLDVLYLIKGKGIRIGLLTNMPPGWASQWGQMVDPSLFDEVVISSKVGARKPDTRIFSLAAAAAGVPQESCILVDDLKANCVGAEAAGWTSVQYQDSPQATQKLTSLLGAAL